MDLTMEVLFMRCCWKEVLTLRKNLASIHQLRKLHKIVSTIRCKFKNDGGEGNLAASLWRNNHYGETDNVVDDSEGNYQYYSNNDRENNFPCKSTFRSTTTWWYSAEAHIIRSWAKRPKKLIPLTIKNLFWGFRGTRLYHGAGPLYNPFLLWWG